MRRTMRNPWVGLLGAAILSLAACELLGASRVRDGQLYRTGEAAYDTYFHDVHELQVVAADFDLDRRAARRPVIEALALTPDAADATIVQVAHEQVAAAAPQIGAAKLEIDGDEARVRTQNGTRGNPETEKILLAIEASAKAEIARGNKLREVQPKIEAALKAGHELEPHVKDDFAKQGGQKPFEVRNELSSSYDVLSVINYRARREVRTTETYVVDLQHAVAIGASSDSSAWPAMPTPASSSTASDAGAPPAHSSPSAPPPHAPPPRHAPAPPATPPPAPSPTPAPKPTSTGEVFNP